jgi:hypothetical protein
MQVTDPVCGMQIDNVKAGLLATRNCILAAGLMGKVLSKANATGVTNGERT